MISSSLHKSRRKVVWTAQYLSAIMMLLPSLLLLCTSFCSANVLLSPASNYSMLFQFGDSLSDTGNAVASFGYAAAALMKPPYGNTYFGYPTGRDSDGRLVLDFLASYLGFPFMEPYMGPKKNKFLKGVNFATCGAKALSAKFYLKHGLRLPGPTWDLPSQMNFFLDFQRKHPQADYSNALYMIGEIGGNDYELMLANGLTFSEMRQLVPYVVQGVGVHIRRLYEAGARAFLVLNAPNQGCIPRHILPNEKKDEFGCRADFNDISMLHNNLLDSTMESLRAELRGCTISVGDFYSAHAKLVKDHQTYGILDPHSICCGHYTNSSETSLFCGEVKMVNGKLQRGEACSNPEQYLYWDAVHFTDHANSMMAAHMLLTSIAFQ